MKETKKLSIRIVAVCLILALCTSCMGVGKIAAKAASKPAKPKFTVTKRTKTTATIKIKKKGTVSGYHIYVKSSKKGKYQVIPSISRTVKLKKLKKNKVYYVKIRAFRVKKLKIKFSKFSKVVKIGKYKKTTKKTTTTNSSTTNTTTNTNTDSSTSTSQTTAQKYAQEVLTLVNKERTAAGLSTLTLDDTLCAAANVRAKEITSVFSHTRPDNSDCFTVLDEYKYTYTTLGENIAAGQATPEAVVNSWMNSEGHRANILSERFNKMGVGYCEVSSGMKYYWTQLFSD